MASISTTLRLIDRFTNPIQRSIDAVDRMIDAMEIANRESMTADLSTAFHEARTSINAANRTLDEFNRDLERMDDDPPQRLSNGFGGLSRAIIVANQGLELFQRTWRGVTDLMSSADNRTSADARLALINDGLRTQEQLEKQVLEVANDTRSAYEETASLVATMGRQDFFKGNNDLALQFAETLNKGFVVSGAGAEEAKNSIRQLTQGIASGVLRGDEFNSVMENASVLAEMMATEFGVTKGELRAMAEDGMLSAEAVVTAIMNQSKAIDEQFSKMPMTFGQGMTIIGNSYSQLLDKLSQPGEALNDIILRVQELIAWLDTADGQAFFDGIAIGISLIIDGLMFLVGVATDVYTFFTDNWSTIEPIFWGLVTVIGILTLAFWALKVASFITTAIQLGMAVVTAIQTGATLAQTSATAAATAAQWGLNAALLANPITWVVIAIIVLIGIIVALVIWILDLWKTNVDFKVGVIKIWNSVLDFFDQVPIFFMGVGYGIADAFSYAKVTSLKILSDLVNGAIDKINWLIDKVNKIPGVSISAIEKVSWGAEAAINEEAKRQSRADKLAGAKNSAAAKSAERASKLSQDEITWRAEIESKKAEAGKKGDIKDPFTDSKLGKEWDNQPIDMDLSKIKGDKLKGGKLDEVGKIGKDVDLSKQSLEYLRDIAEVEALKQFEAIDAYAAVVYEDANAKLSKQDKELLMSVSGRDTNVYYLNYQGGVNVNNDIKKGEDWESIKRDLYEQTQSDIEIGVSEVEEVVFA